MSLYITVPWDSLASKEGLTEKVVLYVHMWIANCNLHWNSNMIACHL